MYKRKFYWKGYTFSIWRFRISFDNTSAAFYCRSELGSRSSQMVCTNNYRNIYLNFHLPVNDASLEPYCEVLFFPTCKNSATSQNRLLSPLYEGNPRIGHISACFLRDDRLFIAHSSMCVRCKKRDSDLRRNLFYTGTTHLLLKSPDKGDLEG